MQRMRIPAVALASALLCAVAAAAEAGRQQLSEGGVEVQFHPGDAGAAREAAASVNFAAETIAHRLGITLRRPVRVMLARGRAEFDRLCGAAMPEWSLAAALPAQERIVADAARATPATANDLRLAMTHETVHLALGQLEAGRRDRLPRWFHEGVADRLSGQRHLNADYGLFEHAAMHGALIPFSRLTDSFPEPVNEAQLAYLQSEAFIAHLLARSPDAVRDILGGYRDGRDFDSALTAAIGLPRAEVEKAWAESLRRSFPWLRTLLASLTFWGVLAVVTIGIFFLVRRRSRRQREEWDREEREWHVVLDEPVEEEPDEEPEDESGEEWKRGR